MPLTPSLSPSEGERVPEGRVRGMVHGFDVRNFPGNLSGAVRIKKTYGFDFANVFRHVPSLGKEVLNVIVRGW